MCALTKLSASAGARLRPHRRIPYDRQTRDGDHHLPQTDRSSRPSAERRRAKSSTRSFEGHRGQRGAANALQGHEQA